VDLDQGWLSGKLSVSMIPRNLSVPLRPPALNAFMTLRNAKFEIQFDEDNQDTKVDFELLNMYSPCV
jgi:hypothetical protein